MNESARVEDKAAGETKSALAKRNFVLLLAGVLLTIGAISSWRALREPRYEGKRFSEWISEATVLDSNYEPHLTYETKMQRRNKAILALAEMGEAAVPRLMRMLKAKDSKLKTWAISVLNRLPRVRIKYPSAVKTWPIAMLAFNPNGKTAKAAIPQLVEMTVQPDDTGRDLPRWAASRLLALGNNSIQPLVVALHSQSPEMRTAAAAILSRFECEAWNTNHLKIGYRSPNQITTTNGEQIIQGLTDALLDSDLRVRTVATNALKAFEENNPR